MGSRSTLLALLGFLMLASFPCAAQESTAPVKDARTPAEDGDTAGFEDALFEDALFNDSLFDAATTGSEEPQEDSVPTGEVKDEKKTEYLVGGNAVVKASSILAQGELTATGETLGKVFAKVSIPDYGALYLAFTGSNYFYQAYWGSDETTVSKDPYQLDLELAELHFSFDLAHTLFVRVGTQLVSWGPSQIWTPSDFINLAKLNPFADLDTRVGVPGLRLHLLLPSSNLFAFADFSGLFDDDQYGDPLKDLSFALRYDFVAGPGEFALSTAGGYDTQVRGGVDFSGRLLGLSVYGELVSAPAYDSYDAYVQASYGFSRSLGDLKRWKVSMEGFFNSRGGDYSGYDTAALAALNLGASELTELYMGTYYLYASIAKEQLFNPALDATLSGVVNIQELCYFVRLALSFDPPFMGPFTVSGTYSGGGENKEFTRYGGNDAVTVTVSTRLSF